MPTSTHSAAKTEIPLWGGGRALLYRVSISHRRGGRPCPPAGIVRIYGNPMQNRNISMGRCRHRPLHEVVFPIPYRRDRCPHRPTLRNGNTPAWGRKGVIVQGFVFHPVGADAPVRPPETARFHGNPMRNRNISMGRCGHRPLQTTAKNRRILRADRVVRPYKWSVKL